MKLGLAGAISGAGEGASKALSLAQAQYGAERLQEARDKGDEDRQARLLEAQKGMHTETLAAQKENTTATIAGQAANTQATIAGQKDIHSEAVQAQREIAGDTNRTHADTAAAHNASAEAIAKMNADMHERVAKLQRDLQTKQFDKTFTAAKMTATTTAMKDLSDQMIHLNQAVSNPLADKSSPEYKSAVEILQKAQRLHMVYQEQLAGMIASGPGGVPASPEFPGKVAGAQTPPALAPFVMPPGIAETPTPAPQAPIKGRPY